MKHILISFFIVFSISVSVDAKLITGEVEYSVEQARVNALAYPSVSFDQNLVRKNLIDENYQENYISLLNGHTNLKDRILAKFSDGSYGVIYKNNFKNVYYYSPEGFLNYNEIRESLDYPYKAIKYSINGNIVNISLRVSENETFIFEKSGNLLAHWIGQKCFDEFNNIIMTRKIYK